MQYGATVHTANNTTNWFNEHNISKKPLPSYSPDLNPIENLWGYLTQRFYANSRQFQCFDTLRATIINAWEAIPNEEIQELNRSM